MTIRIKGQKKSEKPIQIGAAAMTPPRQTSWRNDPRTAMATLRRWEREHSPRTNENRHFQRLYYAKPYLGAGVSTITDTGEGGYKINDLLRRHGANLIAEIVDAAVALLCRRLQPKVLPIGGDYKRQQACKRLGRVIEGVSEAGNWLGVFTEAQRAGLICDAGFALIDANPVTGEIDTWKLDQNYVFWPMDGTATPLEISCVIPVPKATLATRYPDHEEAIMKLPVWRPRRVIGVDDPGTGRQDVDTVAVGRLWSLAQGDRPGRHVVAAGNDLVLDDDDNYKLDVHQIVKFQWKPNANGFAGVPLARTVAPYDLTNKRLLNRTLAALDGAVPWLLVEEESDVQAISDVEFQRVTFPRGSQEPRVIVPNPVSTQQLDRMEANRSAAFRESHINESAAQGQAPLALKSAPAQFAWADAVQTVLLPQQEGWQGGWKHAAQIVVALMGTNQKARVRTGDILAEVTLPDLRRSEYQITMGLVSGLSLTVSGRLEQLSQIQSALPNKLDNEDVLRHVGLPDTQQLADRLLAPRELAEYIIEQALDDGIVVAPPRALGPDGLAALLRIASQEYCGAVKKPRNYYERTHLEALRKVILITEWLMKPPTIAAPVVAPPIPTPAAVEPLPTVPGLGLDSLAGPPGPVPAPLPGIPQPVPITT